MKLPYTLSHNMGEASFETCFDAVNTMWLVAQYDKDCGTTFEMTMQEFRQIERKVEAGEYYTSGYFTLFRSE